MNLVTAKKRMIQGVVLLVVIGLGGTALYTVAALKFTYSAGERVGFVQKLSKRGWVCKTNEGELSMVSLPGQQGQTFLFTVPDDKVVQQIDALAGHKVALQYEEHKGIPSACFGDTPYYVVAVQKAE